MDSMRTVEVGPFAVVDATRRQVVDRVARAVSETHGSSVFLALHVGGLLLDRNTDYVSAAQHADLLYADGDSVVLLARRQGARAIERAPTTDIARDIIDTAQGMCRGTLRVMLVGGPKGLAERAGNVLTREHGVDIVGTFAGFDLNFRDITEAIWNRRPNIVFIGMGVPTEAITAINLRQSCPPGTVIVTCGGWFGFLAGDERRAPLIAQRLHLEWAYRLAQHRGRLAPRYIRGAVKVARMLIDA